MYDYVSQYPMLMNEHAQHKSPINGSPQWKNSYYEFNISQYQDVNNDYISVTVNTISTATVGSLTIQNLLFCPYNMLWIHLYKMLQSSY